MSVLSMLCVSSSALSAGELSHARNPASLPRDCLFSFSLRSYLCSDTVLTV